jgi:hydrogenase maturation protein HypF
MEQSPEIVRVRYTYRGTIQGVGFRPTVFRSAESLGLCGFVRNQRSEVLAEVQGPRGQVDQFPRLLLRLLPRAARIDGMESEAIPVLPESGFSIRESLSTPYSFPPIPPDLAICPECARELLDPADRRYLYPFITCTQCGPRYSIVLDTPFDRETTSMVDFLQCPRCLQEYRQPGDRRFHSQTNSCPDCGPRLVLWGADHRPLPGDPLVETIRALNAGRIVALQGIGGFHLAADPGRREAMVRLRRDKERERKPFALMAAGLDEVRRLCRLAPGDAELLSSIESPILILPARPEVREEMELVSHASTLGVMLPYTPLHLLLFAHPGERLRSRSLVMTSGNRKGEPIVTDPAEAFDRLAGTAELFLHHNRRILFRTDDSILRRSRRGGTVLLRRSRGYVPRLVRLRHPVRRVILGVGGDLKNAPALASGHDVYLAPFQGDLEDPRTQADFEAQVRRILDLYGLEPQVVVHDLHPLYHSTRWAESSGAALPPSVARTRRRIPLRGCGHLPAAGTRASPLTGTCGVPIVAPGRVAVQHHHAHLLSVMAEHHLEEAAGLAFDGTGYGTDGTVWGGEFMHATRRSFRRLGCLRPFGLPGGEAAVLHPIRIAVALLAGELPPPELRAILRRVSGLEEPALELLLGMLDRNVNVTLTSSLGRLFDAAAALLGLVDRVSYEGEGPIRLEGLAMQAFDPASFPPAAREPGAVPGVLQEELRGLLPVRVPPQPGAPFHLDWGPLMVRLAREAASGRGSQRPDPRLALLFHQAVARGAREGARLLREQTGLSRLALSGGVFQNMLLRELLLPALEEDGFEVYLNQAVPAGDGGLALGQVYLDLEADSEPDSEPNQE